MARWLTLSSLALLALASPSRADERSEELVRSFVADMDGRSGWSVTLGEVRSAGDDTILDDLVLTRAAPALEVRIGQARLAGLEEREGGGFSAAEVEVTDAALSSASTEIALPAFAATDLSTPNLLDVTFDPERPVSSIGRLYSAFAELSVAEAEASTIGLTQRMEGPDAAPVESVT